MNPQEFPSTEELGIFDLSTVSNPVEINSVPCLELRAWEQWLEVLFSVSTRSFEVSRVAFY